MSEKVRRDIVGSRRNSQGGVISIGDRQIVAVEEGGQIHVGLVMQMIEGRKHGPIRSTTSTEALRRRVCDAIEAPYRPTGLDVMDDDAFEQALADGSLPFAVITGHMIVRMRKALPDLCVTQCNCGECQNILVDNDLIMITIVNAPCGFFVLPTWAYAYLEAPTPVDPSVLMQHEAKAVELINRISQTLRIPIAELNKSAMH